MLIYCILSHPKVLGKHYNATGKIDCEKSFVFLLVSQESKPANSAAAGNKAVSLSESKTRDNVLVPCSFAARALACSTN